MTRDDWKLRKMPKSRSTIRVSRRFSAREIEKIKLAFRPPDMDYKWFIFFEQDRLYIHRSWTGYCIYIVRFENEGRDYVACEVRSQPGSQAVWGERRFLRRTDGVLGH